MTVDETIKILMMNYPGLFPTKYNVLEHLFLVNGNGFEWVDGELVDRYSEDYASSKHEKISKLINEFRDTLNKTDRLYLDCENEEERNHALTTKANSLIRDLSDVIYWEENYVRTSEYYLKRMAEKRKKVYPATIKYCKLGEIPDNIKDDWREIIIQYIDFLDHHIELLYDTTIDEWDKFIEVRNKLINKPIKI